VYVANVREATYTGSLEIYRKNHTHTQNTHIHSNYTYATACVK